MPDKTRKLALALLFVALPALAGEDSIYEAAVASQTRLPADYDRDEQRKPAQVMAFIGIAKGDVVLDLFSGGGYYAELLAHVAGPDGKVYAHSNQAYLNFVGDEFEARHADGRLANVDVLMAENNQLSLAPAQFDAITIVLGFHDLWHVDVENGWPKIDVDRLLAELYQSLKPGGVLGIVDHAAEPGSPPETGESLHRIDPAIVIETLEDTGFVFEDRSDILQNRADDRSKSVFDPALRGRTDRFVLRFRKPA